MEKENLSKILDIIKKSQCPHGCRCFKVTPDKLCKAKRMGVDSLLECLEARPDDCVFAFPFGGSYFCRCTTRLEIAKLLGE
jgi:hypothetical protein